MKFHRPVAVAAAVILATGLGTGVAMAASNASPATVTPATVTPATVTPAATTPAPTDTTDPGNESAPETGTAGSETGASDGPGGHADPAGNVDHQFEGNE
jgi:hypothetical protein